MQGKNFIDAAKAAGVKFIVFSSLEDEGEHDVPHLRSKAVIEAYLKSSGIPYATVRYPFYYENWVYFMPPRKDEGKESYTLVSPTGQEGWHQISVADGGPVVAKMLADPDAFEGKCVGLAGASERRVAEGHQMGRGGLRLPLWRSAVSAFPCLCSPLSLALFCRREGFRPSGGRQAFPDLWQDGQLLPHAD